MEKIMNKEILPVIKSEPTADESCQYCVTPSELCLKATLKDVMSTDADIHNSGVRTLLVLARRGGGLFGAISCPEQGCDYRGRVDPHYLVIDML
jgi:hypothetical protein